MTTPTEYVLYSLFIDTFSARTDAYIENSAAYVFAPLTPEVISEAFTKGRSISGFSARQSPLGRVETNVGVIDFDHTQMDNIQKVKLFLDGHDIPALLVGSRRGGHLWTFHQGDGTHGTSRGGGVPANVVRRTLEAALHLTGEEAGAEVFPKASAKPGGWGAVRMPLFKHPKSGLIYPAYDTNGQEVTDLLALVNLCAHLQAPWNAVWRLSGGEVASVDYPRDVSPYRAVYRPHGDETVYPSVSEQLGQLGVEATPGHSVRCPFHSDHKASLSIARDDERAFCKAPTCPLYNDGRGMGSISLFKAVREGALRAL